MRPMLQQNAKSEVYHDVQLNGGGGRELGALEIKIASRNQAGLTQVRHRTQRPGSHPWAGRCCRAWRRRTPPSGLSLERGTRRGMTAPAGSSCYMRVERVERRRKARAEEEERRLSWQDSTPNPQPYPSLASATQPHDEKIGDAQATARLKV